MTSPAPSSLPSYPWPPPDEEILEVLQRAYQDGSWGKYHGPHVQELEAALAAAVGSRHALCCCSGTFAVELALRGLGISPGDGVILAGYDFPGNFRAIEAVGARPLLVDILDGRFTIDPDLLPDNPPPHAKGIIVSHLHGDRARLSALGSWARDRGLAVVEDACQSPGALIDGRPAGQSGDVGVFSFGGSKLLSAGRGGAIVTSRDDVAQRCKITCERGNHAFPLSELQAALLLPQLKKLAARNLQRERNVQRLLARLADDLPLRQGFDLPDPGGSYYKVGFYFQPNALWKSRDQFAAAARELGVPLDAGFRGFASRGRRRCDALHDLPHSTNAANNGLILHHPILLAEPAEIDRLADVLNDLAHPPR